DRSGLIVFRQDKLFQISQGLELFEAIAGEIEAREAQIPEMPKAGERPQSGIGNLSARQIQHFQLRQLGHVFEAVVCDIGVDEPQCVERRKCAEVLERFVRYPRAIERQIAQLGQSFENAQVFRGQLDVSMADVEVDGVDSLKGPQPLV